MNGMPSGIGLDICGASKHYGHTIAVDDVSLKIEPGEFLTLLGPSGSGKTSLLMLIAGFQELSAGDIRLEGKSIASVPPEKRNFGMVFQGYALFPHMSVTRNISYPLEVRSWDKNRIQKRVGEMLDLVQLTQFAERMPRQLSGGQQQRVALARALSFSPKILLLDEPLGALDRKLRVDVQEQLKKVHRRVGTTFVYVTHDQEEALTMSDRIVIMNHGKIVQVGSPSELYETPRTAFAASFLGKSNFLVRDGATLALRPEKIDVYPAGEYKAKIQSRGRVISITYMGSIIRLVVHTEHAGDLEVHADAWRMTHRFMEGDAVDLVWSDLAAVQVAPESSVDGCVNTIKTNPET
jgi:putative spermidine/putrescine transport system ATP-binding protein